jgi:hypothetical protein
VSHEPTATTSRPQSHRVLAGLDKITGPLEALYRDLRLHPELSNHEQRTAKFAPVVYPTLETGGQTLTTATLSYLGRQT